MDNKTLAGYLDLANHHSQATPEDIKKLCQNVLKFGFATAFVNSCYLSLARGILKDKARLGTVVSFPLGQDLKEAKIFSSLEAVKAGADELDVSMNVGWFKAGLDSRVLAEMQEVVWKVKKLRQDVLVKFIIEAGLLTDEEIKKASRMVLEAGADFVKTNSGMVKRGVRIKDIELVREVVGGKIKIKAAGGVKTRAQALELIKKGADRIGTSKAVEIILETEVKNEG